MTDVWGYADLHCHPMSHLGFGGAQVAAGDPRLFWGDPSGGDHASCLPCCDPAHSIFQTPSLISLLVDKRHGCGDPSYVDWPRYDTISHQQMYVEWMRRAYDSGLRLICALAVHNRFLADLYNGGSFDNSDTLAVSAQLAGMKKLVDQESDWMEVVLSPAHARAVIGANKLAVVLGVEVDSPGDLRSEKASTDAQVDALIADFHAMGVRTLTPIHLANNAFGGCSFANDQYSLLNHYLGDGAGGQHFFDIVPKPQSTNGVEFLLDTDPGRKAQVSAYLDIIQSGPDIDADYPDYRAIRIDGHRNAAGLTNRGRRLVSQIMKRGLLLDVDHMSDLTRDEVLTLAEGRAYPVYSSHTGLRELGLKQLGDSMVGVASEAQLARRTLERIRDLGGLIAPVSRQGPTLAHLPNLATTPRTLGRDTSLSWAHAYTYALDLMGDERVAIGTDFNGFGQQPGPRRKNGVWVGPSREVRYDVEKQVQLDVLLKRYSLETRTFDINDDGLAHFGMLPDFLRDVANLLQSEDRFIPFFRSSEYFLQMWERCEAQAG